ncbi:MAG: hypothetical protein IKI49_06655 [Oscillospiraceae bacterium]|nr:hypothetical protein [Oscillospiraceae bacterium]
MRGYRRIAAIFLAFMIVFTLSACKKSPENIDAPPSDGEETKTLTPEEFKAVWEGVYESGAGVVVIRDAENDGFRFSVATDALSLSGNAVSDDKLLLETDGGDGFSEIFTRNDEDPYTFALMREDAPENAARFDMTAVTRYEDPKGRFAVSMPDIFDLMPDEAQPDDGVYMQTDDGAVYIMVETTKKVADTEDALIDYLDGLGNLTTTRPDGTVIYSRRFTDGTNDPWAEFYFMRILPDTIVKVTYACAYELYDECSAGCSLISIE